MSALLAHSAPDMLSGHRFQKRSLRTRSRFRPTALTQPQTPYDLGLTQLRTAAGVDDELSADTEAGQVTIAVANVLTVIMGVLGGLLGVGLVGSSLMGAGIVAKARWDNGRVHGPLVPGTAKVLAARKRWLHSALVGDQAIEESDLYEIELQIDVRGHESYNVTRNCWITNRRGDPVVGKRYLIRVSTTDPSRFRVEWNKPWEPTIPTIR